MKAPHDTIDPHVTAQSNESGTFTARWNQFWFEPTSVHLVAQLRVILCLITGCYFLSCLPDVATWYGRDGVLSHDQVTAWASTEGDGNELRWQISPLFLTDNLIVYRGWSFVGVALCLAVALGRGGRWASIAVWLTLVAWANRSLLVAGIAEPLLSMSWLAVSIAPAARAFPASNSNGPFDRHWTATLSTRLLAVQGTIVGLATFSTMLAGRVWWNGLGSYALAAPVEDRYLNAAIWISPMIIHEPLTPLLLWMLPLGLFLAWQPRYQTFGRALLLGWTLAIALLTSHFLYAATFSVMFLAIRRNVAPDTPQCDSKEMPKKRC